MLKTIRTNPTKTIKRKFMDSVNDDVKKYNCIVCCGHTHFKTISDTYLNSGSWGYNRDYLELNNGDVLFISDLHIGAKDKPQEFLIKEKEDLEALLLNPKYKEIILCGDIIDLWATNPLTFQIDYAWFFELLNKIPETVKVYWGIGNHSADLKLYPNITVNFKNIYFFEDFYSCTYNGKLYRFTHGHNYDISSSNWTIKLFYSVWMALGDNLWFLFRYKDKALKLQEMFG